MAKTSILKLWDQNFNEEYLERDLPGVATQDVLRM